MEERISDLRERGVGAAHAVAQSYVCVCFSYVAYPLPVSPEFLFHFLVATVSFLEVSIDVSSHVTVALVTGLAAFFSLLTPPLSCSCSLSSSLSSRFLPFRIFRLWKQTLWNSFQQLFSSLSFEYCLFGDDSSQVFILLFLRRPLFFLRNSNRYRYARIQFPCKECAGFGHRVLRRLLRLPGTDSRELLGLHQMRPKHKK